jgi:hypothetical protein
MAVGGFMEVYRDSIFGACTILPTTTQIDVLHFLGIHGDTWEISGDGTTPFALTSMEDIGRFVVRATLLAHNEPDRVPARLRVFSDLKCAVAYIRLSE